MGPRAVIPDAVMARVLYALHDDPTSGHIGVSKTLLRFRQRFYNSRDRRQVKSYVQSCHYCQTRKQQWTNRLGRLKPIQPATRPFERIGMDTLGPFRPSGEGNRKILVITDYFTRWAIARPIPRETAEIVADILLDEIFTKFGAPEVIISDRGSAFQSKVLRELFTDFRSKHVMSSPYHPQTNGLTERFNKTLAGMLAMYVSEKQQEWDEYIPFAVFAYNTVRQDSTGFSPYHLLYGVEPRLLAELVPPGPEDQTFAGRMEELHAARELAIVATRWAQGNQKAAYDKGRHILSFQEGDTVLVFKPRSNGASKLRLPWEGPFVVLKRYSDLNYLVQRMEGERKADRLLVHISRLKRYYQRPDENHRREQGVDVASLEREKEE